MYDSYIKKLQKKRKKRRECVVCVHGYKDDEEVSKWLELVEAGQVSPFWNNPGFQDHLVVFFFRPSLQYETLAVLTISG